MTQGCQIEVLQAPCTEYVGKGCGWPRRWPYGSRGQDPMSASGLWVLPETGHQEDKWGHGYRKHGRTSVPEWLRCLVTKAGLQE